MLPGPTNSPLQVLVREPTDEEIAEEMGIIHALTAWVLENALTQLRKWLDAGLDLSISVNVSPRCIEDHSLEEMVARALGTFKVEPQRLTLEITEGVAMAAAAAKALHRLNEMGVRLALDDFGTGYSSLAHLQRFPVDALKIDRSFITGLAHTHAGESLVHTLVQLGKALSIETFAEGIEQQQELSLLRDEDCDSGQGFLFARPLDAAATEAFFENWAAKRAADQGQTPQPA